MIPWHARFRVPCSLASLVINPLRSEQEAFRFLSSRGLGADRARDRLRTPGASLNPDLELAGRAARDAGEVLLGYYGREPRGWAKSRKDLVSDADSEAERRSASSSGPSAAGRNAGRGSSESVATAQALDRRSPRRHDNFLYGFRLAVSIALEDRDGLVVGWSTPRCTRRPSTRARRGARLGGHPAACAREPRAGRAMIATASPTKPSAETEQAEVMLRLLPWFANPGRGAAALDWPGWPPGGWTSTSADETLGPGRGAVWWRGRRVVWRSRTRRRAVIAAAGQEVAGRTD